ncbi:zinc-binding dehydrogenase [Bacillus sp. J14TS2]|uniref:zinc-binding dehydrogenase n=1 Tax=Bacillus sp. J14TS2 TaxID=2807188 RepID=UPI0035B56B8D
MQELVDLYEKDKLHIHIRERFPLCKANAAAHRKVESGHGRGKGCSSNQLVLK